MGQGEQETRKAAPLSEAAFAGALIESLNRIAAGIEANAQATEMLARATAGEFDQQDGQSEREVSLSGRPL